jgi:hypothetical protein
MLPDRPAHDEQALGARELLARLCSGWNGSVRVRVRGRGRGRGRGRVRVEVRVGVRV